MKKKFQKWQTVATHAGSSRSHMFIKIDVLKFCNIHRKMTVSECEYCEIFNNNFLTEPLRMTGSDMFKTN